MDVGGGDNCKWRKKTVVVEGRLVIGVTKSYEVYAYEDRV